MMMLSLIRLLSRCCIVASAKFEKRLSLYDAGTSQNLFIVFTIRIYNICVFIYYIEDVDVRLSNTETMTTR